LKLGDCLVLCRTINPTLKYLKVAREGGQISEPSDCVVEASASYCRHRTDPQRY
jgi:hypothetical protein